MLAEGRHQMDDEETTKVGNEFDVPLAAMGVNDVHNILRKASSMVENDATG